MRQSLTAALAVAGGGALGALARWGLGILALEVARRFPPPWRTLPLGTLATNLLGCAAIGVLVGVFEVRWDPSPATRAFLLVGVLGGFTTFSSFAVEAAQMLEEGRSTLALAYVAGSTILGLLAAILGWKLGRGW